MTIVIIEEAWPPWGLIIGNSDDAVIWESVSAMSWLISDTIYCDMIDQLDIVSLGCCLGNRDAAATVVLCRWFTDSQIFLCMVCMMIIMATVIRYRIMTHIVHRDSVHHQLCGEQIHDSDDRWYESATIHRKNVGKLRGFAIWKTIWSIFLYNHCNI